MPSEVQRKKGFKVELSVNGKRIGLNPYVQSVFTNVLIGILGTLKGAGKPASVELRLKKLQG